MATRRQVLIALGGGALCSPFRSFAQSQSRLPRIGYLSFAPITDAPSPERAAFLDGLRDLGYIDRKTITIEYQSGEMNVEMLPDAAEELVDRKVDLIVAAGTVAAVAAKNATKSIPVVMMFSSEPVASGLVKSLAKPGGNVTGTANLSLGGKHVELMREVLPHLTRLAILINPTNPAARPFVAGMTQAARNASIDVTIVEVSRPEEFAQAYASLRNARADWLHVVDEPMISSRRAEWVAFASAARLPLSSDVGETARLGGLISYAPSSTEHYLLAAVYVDKILQGAKPADLPVQEPTRYELILNLKTANTLGLTIPRSVLLRAQEVIQ